MYNAPCVTFKMSRVALVVVANSILAGRIRDIMSRKGWNTEICEDGDKAVDEYVRLEPEMVFLSLDLPTMDGHIAALEMRETDKSSRIVFVSSKTRLSKTQDAAYSSGAVTTLVTPITFGSVDREWAKIMGDIPEAPGLSDLDALYPDIEEPEPDFPEMPPLPSFLPVPAPIILEPISEVSKSKKGRKLKLFMLSLVILCSSLGILHYLEYVDIQAYLDELLTIFN
jgi:CheY-like chemotaxis protein